MGSWSNDFKFRRVAALLWPGDYDIATRGRRGRAEANRVLQARFEGWSALRGLARLRSEVDSLIEETTGVRRGS